jgi:hypothetical protein
MNPGIYRVRSLAPAPTSEEFQKSVDAWHDRMIWFIEQPNEVKKRFDPFLQIHE